MQTRQMTSPSFQINKAATERQLCTQHLGTRRRGQRQTALELLKPLVKVIKKPKASGWVGSSYLCVTHLK